MDRHGRRDLPFGGTRIPKISFCFFSILDAVEEIDKEDQHGKCDEESGNRHQEMREIEPKRRIVIHDAAAHASKTDHHHT